MTKDTLSVLVEVCEVYNRNRAKWLKEGRDPEGFDAWFTSQVFQAGAPS